MKLFVRTIRCVSRSYLSMILMFITIIMTFSSFHLYKKDQNRQQESEIFQPPVVKRPQYVPINLASEEISNKGTIELFFSRNFSFKRIETARD